MVLSFANYLLYQFWWKHIFTIVVVYMDYLNILRSTWLFHKKCQKLTFLFWLWSPKCPLCFLDTFPNCKAPDSLFFLRSFKPGSVSQAVQSAGSEEIKENQRFWRQTQPCQSSKLINWQQEKQIIQKYSTLTRHWLRASHMLDFHGYLVKKLGYGISRLRRDLEVWDIRLIGSVTPIRADKFASALLTWYSFPFIIMLLRSNNMKRTV